MLYHKMIKPSFDIFRLLYGINISGGVMIPSYVIGNFFVYLVINAFTPGPGNIIAFNTVTSYGIKKGRLLFLGIFAGYFVVQSICAVFVFGLGSFLPAVLKIIKYVGAAYIVWLAIHIAISKPEKEDESKSASFGRGMVSQLVNVKIYMLGITAITGYVTDYNSSFAVIYLFEMIIVSVGVIATLTWIGLGYVIQDIYMKHFRIINIALSIILLECVYSILK